MGEWDAALYSRFERERTRPAADLLAQVGSDPPATVFDLGCGPGNSTELLARRFPNAVVTGIDTSEGMLTAARERLPACRFEPADIATWRPSEPADLLFANASLQWVPEHEILIPRLLGMLAPGGTLAVQVPDNWGEPSHSLMRAAAAEQPWAAFINASSPRPRLLSPQRYYDLLASNGASVTLWRTIYHHPIVSAAAIVDWVRATGLRPYLDGLPAQHRPGFVARYQAMIDAAYAVRADGMRLLAFPRLFLVATLPPLKGA